MKILICNFSAPIDLHIIFLLMNIKTPKIFPDPVTPDREILLLNCPFWTIFTIWSYSGMGQIAKGARMHRSFVRGGFNVKKDNTPA